MEGAGALDCWSHAPAFSEAAMLPTGSPDPSALGAVFGLAQNSRYRARSTGEAWLRFLDRSYGGKGFSEGPGRRLPTIAYATPARAVELPDDEQAALFRLVRRWIRRHRVRV